LRVYSEKTLKDILEIPISVENVGKTFNVVKSVAEIMIGSGCRQFYFTGCGIFLLLSYVNIFSVTC
jgi:hypothetical protein